MKLQNVRLIDIEIGDDRRRKDYGDIEELATSIKEDDLICPIAVYSETGDPPNKLCAGGRRLAAFLSLEREEIPANIFDHPLNELELKRIELHENIKRKDLHFKEEVALKRDIHQLEVELYGEKVSTSPYAPGQSIRDTAKMLGESSGNLSRELKLAEIMDQMPELGWDACKNKSEALKMMDRIEETLIRSEISKRAQEMEGETSNKRLIDAYFVGDLFDHIENLPDRTFDVVEIDPPYAINLPQLKLHSGGGSSGGNKFQINYGTSYNEVDASQYKFFVAGMLKECYRIMNDHSWLIFWFGPEPWFDTMYRLIIDTGFKTRRIPGIWTKPGGQTNHPDIYLASCYEMFYYAYKGDATININKRGRSNVFTFDPVSPSKKIHPTERPVPLMKELLDVFGYEGARVYVPCCGSGNTLIAANELNMYPIGVDLSQEYKDSYTTRILAKEI